MSPSNVLFLGAAVGNPGTICLVKFWWMTHVRISPSQSSIGCSGRFRRRISPSWIKEYMRGILVKNGFFRFVSPFVGPRLRHIVELQETVGLVEKPKTNSQRIRGPIIGFRVLILHKRSL